jgi:excisionase family DNA binding protein
VEVSAVADLLTVHDVAQLLDVTSDTIRYHVKKGRLRALFTRSGQRLFRPEDVAEFRQLWAKINKRDRRYAAAP